MPDPTPSPAADAGPPGPVDEAGVAARIRAAGEAGAPLEIRGGGTRRALGRPVQAAATLDLSRLTGILWHDPGALTFAARAGTPLAEVEAALAAAGQQLAFEPPDHRSLLASRGEPTLGGVAAGNLSGPRRLRAGACRDSLLGLRFVDGSGRIIAAGGRVMKNVAGYDLVKLLCGSWGTLGALTELCFRVAPIPPSAVTLELAGLDIAASVAAMSRALGSPYELSGAAWLPGPPTRTLLRVEGLAGQVDARLAGLRRLLPEVAERVVEGEAHTRLWRSVRDADLFAGDARPVWRLSVRPGDAPALATELGRELAAEVFLDWGGGLVWVRLPESPTADAARIRELLARRGGHGMLVRAPAPVRAAVPVFSPETGPVAALSQALRQKFDPLGVLNPGRMQE